MLLVRSWDECLNRGARWAGLNVEQGLEKIPPFMDVNLDSSSHRDGDSLRPSGYEIGIAFFFGIIKVGPMLEPL